MKLQLLLFLFGVPFLTAWSEQTNRLDLATLGALGTGVTVDGWTVSNLSNYSERYWYALRFNQNAALAISPVYPTSIVRLDLTVFSSSPTNTRPFVIIPESSVRGVLGDQTFRVPASPGNNLRTYQSVCWDPALNIDRFRLAVEHGDRTCWGVVALAVITADPPRAHDGFVLRLR